MAQTTLWLAMSYTLPVSPSKARVYVWRKLREQGAQYLHQGVALIPRESPQRHAFESLAQKIRTMGGESVLFEMRFEEHADELAMVEKFRNQHTQEMERFRRQADEFFQQTKDAQDDTARQGFRKLLRQYTKLQEQDHLKVAAPQEKQEDGLHTIFSELARETAQAMDMLRGVFLREK